MKCSKCKENKSIDRFAKDPTRKGGYDLRCKDCRKTWYANYYKGSTKEKGRHLKRKYGITYPQYLEMFQNQKGACLICNKDNDGKALNVDHNHFTGKVRGLLCNNCNVALGLMMDSPEIIIKAYEYVRLGAV